MNYKVLIDARTARALATFPKSVVLRLDAAILGLATDPRPAGTKRLKGKLKEGWRIRIGNYRVLYRIDDEAKEVRIFDVGHRRDVYR